MSTTETNTVQNLEELFSAHPEANTFIRDFIAYALITNPIHVKHTSMLFSEQLSKFSSAKKSNEEGYYTPNEEFLFI